MSNTTTPPTAAVKPQVNRRVLWPLLAFALSTGPALGTIGLALSYLTIAKLAKALGMPGDEHLYPIAIDVGILAALATDILFVYLNRPLWFLRPVAWALTAFTVWANFHGGTTGHGMDIAALARMGLSASTAHHVQAGLHVVMPSLWVVLLEALRAGLLHDRRRASGGTSERVPPVRWLLSPVRTALLYRRMRLWGVSSYPLALGYEAARLHGIDIVRSKQSGPWARLTWRWRIPRLLRVDLTSGNMPDEVAEEVARVVESGRRTGWRRAVHWWVAGELENAAKDDEDSPADGADGADTAADGGADTAAGASGARVPRPRAAAPWGASGGTPWGVPEGASNGASGGTGGGASKVPPEGGLQGASKGASGGTGGGASKGASGGTRPGASKSTGRTAKKTGEDTRITVTGMSDEAIIAEYMDGIDFDYKKANPGEEVTPTHLHRHRLAISYSRATKILKLYYSDPDSTAPDSTAPDSTAPDSADPGADEDAQVVQLAGRG